MLIRDVLSWWRRPAFLRPGGPRSDTLYAGPWVGELGWELMSFQAFVRRLSRAYTRTVVICRRGSEALYRDFASEIIVHDVRGTADCNRLQNVENPEQLTEIAARVPKHADWLRPLGHQPLARQDFIRFGEPSPTLASDIVFHPRGRAFGADRNYGSDSWRELLGLLRGRGYRLTCIGLSQATVPVEGDFIDFRDRPLAETMSCLASARLVIGPSSGPMHLASLCGTAHLVWADRRRFARGLRSRDKYEWAWNPLRTPVRVYDREGFQPRVAAIAHEVEALLSELSRTKAQAKAEEQRA